MKKITLFFLLTFSFVFTSELMAQTLNQNASWPNANWTVTGVYNTDPLAFEADPTLTANFAFDDDDAGNGSDDDIAAESPVIDLTAAFGAGETWLTVSVDFTYNDLDDTLTLEYWDADAGAWTTWEQFVGTADQPQNDFCAGARDSFTSIVLNIAGFTGTQQSGFRYRISFLDDGGAGGAAYEWGFCFDAPTITSATPPACPDPTSLTATPTSPIEATIAWTEAGTAMLWDVELVDITAAGTATGTPTASGVANPYMLMGLTAQNDYEIYVRSDCSGSTSNWVGPVAFTTPAVPPANDECDAAVALTVNADLACGVVTSGTTVGGTASPQPDDATGTPDNDVWFTFVATGAQHQISLLNVTAVIGTSTDMGMSVFDDAAGCNMTAANEVGESDPNSLNLTGLTNGNTYYVRVYGWSGTNSAQTTFDICVGTPPAPPANDECDAAVALTVNADLACGVVTSGTTVSATESPQPDDATGTPNNDVWFTFVATGAEHQISLLNIVAQVGTSVDMGMSVFDDAAGCNMTAANEVGESDPNTLSLTGLTGGNTYYVRVYGWSSSPTATAQTTFDVCVGTPPSPPANDECDAAVALTVNADLACGVVTSGTTVSATESPQPDDATGTPNNDVWFTFVATGAEHQISLLNVVAQVGTSTDMGMSVFDDAAGCNMTAANEVGESDPNTLDLTGLTGGNTYYVRVYGWSSSPTGTAQTTFDVCVGTPPSCVVPENLDAAFVAPSSADLSWTAPTDGTTPVGYNWEVVPQGNAQGDGVVSSGSTADLFDTATGLTVDTLYDLRVQSDCGGGDTSSWSQPFTFNAGYCIPNGTSTATYIDDFSTSGNDMNITNLSSGLAPNNYQNNSATMSASGGPNATIDFEVVIVGGTVGCAVWVDWNNDFVFDTSEVAFSTTSYGNGPFNGTITIPDATPDGDYRMRVLIDWNDANPGDDAPCSYGSAATPRGETEDYTITVDASLSTDEFENENAFTYFPNPVKNTLTLNAQNAIDAITVINMLGQEVLTIAPRELRSELDMSQLQTGTYFVKVTINDVTETIRIIKQ
ncbi:GEVED domain-containing protein [uncultured Psychroserpens sp.]|uniref:fibronectin type III domain-containing protein n=1 Tax=uncultured Psychroserpens sp. TaxID=255436 RepID=UPI002621D145|nr:GEVED domain-containing protein [uncultured Psychroserpens sp.]